MLRHPGPTVLDTMGTVLITAREDMSVADAAHIMSDHGILHLPVRDEAGRVVGMVSDRDVRLASFRDPENGEAPILYADAPIGQIMTPRVLSVPGGSNVAEAAERMREHKVGALLVEHGGRTVGIITSDDLLGVLSSMVPVQARRPPMRARGGL